MHDCFATACEIITAMHTENYFLQIIASLISELNLHIGCPRLLRTDCGTENSILAYVQPFLRRSHTDSRSGVNSFCYVKSTANQVSTGLQVYIYSFRIFFLKILMVNL